MWRIGLMILVAALLYQAGVEFYNVAAGTGAWIGEFSKRWALAFGGFVASCAFLIIALGILVRPRQNDSKRWSTLAGWRESLGVTRWLAAGIVFALPVWFLQYSPWGVVFSKPFMRILIWCLTSSVGATLVTRDPNRLWTWKGVLLATLLCGAAFALAQPLMSVTNYPFSLGWSEGNRLWDYSLLFGRSLYTYRADAVPVAYLDLGRQAAGGLPFLLPSVSILDERGWLAAMSILPYLILGWLAFLPADFSQDRSWILAGVWGFLFLDQGPIHTPLLACAALVALAWRLPRWPAAAFVCVSGYFAEVSRFTWMFAPAMWAAMLQLTGISLPDDRIPVTTWRRALGMGLAGLLGAAMAVVTGVLTSRTSASSTPSASTQQPLLWYRLFPNATFGQGILIGLLLATAPLIVTLILLVAGNWRLNRSQKLAIILPSATFLLVGLVVSTKIGGGGDLHNMDMFLIGLMFAAAAAWRAGAAGWFGDLERAAAWKAGLCLILIAVPAFPPLMALRSISFAADASWLAVLADTNRPRDLGSLPGTEVVNYSLHHLNEAVKDAQTHGQVLFMDQRQLLTFGYVRSVELVGEYEKKRMMDAALGSDAAYFQGFYRDLAAHRFSLIISSPLRTPIKDREFGFGEENNAWVKWVAKPVLCYYEEEDSLTDVKVELLVPRVATPDCSSSLP